MSINPFRYVTTDDVRAAGITEQSLPECDLLPVIEQAGELVNMLTNNWFIPIKKTLYLDGDGSYRMLLPAPIVELVDTEPTLDTDRDVKQTLLPKVAVYEPYGSIGHPTDMFRTVARNVGIGDFIVTPGSFYLEAEKRFPEGIKNVSVSGVFGHVQNPIAKIEATTTVDVTAGDTTITLDDVTGFSKGKVLLIFDDDDDVVYTGIIKAVTTGTNVLTIEAAVVDATITSGATAVVYGSIPYAVKRATLMLIYDLAYTISDSIDATDAGRIYSETTDNYKYMKTKSDGVTSSGGGSLLTSVPYLLQSYSRPAFIGFA